jgi:hypothetical protein
MNRVMLIHAKLQTKTLKRLHSPAAFVVSISNAPPPFDDMAGQRAATKFITVLPQRFLMTH